MITGESKISGRTAHPTFTSPKVRLTWNSPKCSRPASAGLAEPFRAPRMRRIQVYGNVLLGSPETSVYKGIAFFQDRGSAAHTHSWQGGGGLSITGTIYLTNTEPTMRAAPSHYQTLSLQGNPASATSVTGEIIVDALSLGGNSVVRMNLNPLSLTVRKVALVR